MSSLPKQILFVSHDGGCCESISRRLNYEAEHYALTAALTADQALFLMTDETFDLYILDNLSKGTSSSELCRRLREKDRHTPILFFGGMNHSANGNSEIAVGANEYLDKSNDLDRLAEMVKRLLAKDSSSPAPNA